MSLQDIIQKIHNEAEQKKSELEKETQKKQEEVKQETEKKKQEMHDSHEAFLSRSQKHQTEQARARAHQHILQEKEKAKRDAINNVYTNAYKELISISTADYISFVHELALQLPKNIDEGDVLLPTTRYKETQQALTQAGIQLNPVSSENIQGGFIISTPKAEYNYSFKQLVTYAHTQTELEVSQILFKTA